jgi:hypothetical protein
LIAAATGSKMQTVGLALVKQVLPDIHVEYPTPKSYYVPDEDPYSVSTVQEINFDNLRATIDTLRSEALDFDPKAMCG